jgi:hypothetical protein
MIYAKLIEEFSLLSQKSYNPSLEVAHEMEVMKKSRVKFSDGKLKMEAHEKPYKSSKIWIFFYLHGGKASFKVLQLLIFLIYRTS